MKKTKCLDILNADKKCLIKIKTESSLKENRDIDKDPFLEIIN